MEKKFLAGSLIVHVFLVLLIIYCSLHGSGQSVFFHERARIETKEALSYSDFVNLPSSSVIDGAQMMNQSSAPPVEPSISVNEKVTKTRKPVTDQKESTAKKMVKKKSSVSPGPVSRVTKKHWPANKKSASVSRTKLKQEATPPLLKNKMMRDLVKESTAVGREERQKKQLNYLKEQVNQSLLSLKNQNSQWLGYISRVRDRIYSQVLYPSHFSPDVAAVVEVTQRPDGRVVSVRLLKMSGNSVYDRQILDSVYRSSPLPVPKNPDLFQEKIVLRFRPQRES